MDTVRYKGKRAEYARRPGAEFPTLRFDRFAEKIIERVDPAEAEADIYVRLEHPDPESLKIRRWGTPDDVKGEMLRFHEGDVIFGRRRFYQRKGAVAEFEGICSAHAMVLRVRKGVMLQSFLPFFLQSETFCQRAMQISVGSLPRTQGAGRFRLLLRAWLGQTAGIGAGSSRVFEQSRVDYPGG